MKYVKPDMEIVEFAFECVDTVAGSTTTDFTDPTNPTTPIDPDLWGDT